MTKLVRGSCLHSRPSILEVAHQAQWETLTVAFWLSSRNGRNSTASDYPSSPPRTVVFMV